MGDKHVKRLSSVPRCAANDKTGWAMRHMEAVRFPRTELEGAYVALLRGWLVYADAHQNAYESKIGDDGVLGPEWARIGSALRALLNGDLGRLDGGTLDGILCAALEAEDFDPDSL